jgi:hypothetical protein
MASDIDQPNGRHPKHRPEPAENITTKTVEPAKSEWFDPLYLVAPYDHEHPQEDETDFEKRLNDLRVAIKRLEPYANGTNSSRKSEWFPRQADVSKLRNELIQLYWSIYADHLRTLAAVAEHRWQEAYDEQP